MDWFVRAFIKSSVAWLGLGVTLGVAMAGYPAWAVHRTAHMHMNLLGFVTMMIFGVAYHVLPRFSGRALRYPRLAGMHWWISNAGLALMVAGFVMRTMAGVSALPATLVLATGGSLSALGAYAFAINIWRTLDSKAPAQVALSRAASAAATATATAASPQPVVVSRRS